MRGVEEMRIVIFDGCEDKESGLVRTQKYLLILEIFALMCQDHGLLKLERMFKLRVEWLFLYGYDWSVIKGSSGEVLGSADKITIGDNCFIGMNAVILKSSTICENCIVGAGSVVTGVVPSNSVAVGNSARVIMSLSEYRKKRIDAQKKRQSW